VGTTPRAVTGDLKFLEILNSNNQKLFKYKKCKIGYFYNQTPILESCLVCSMLIDNLNIIKNQLFRANCFSAGQGLK